MIPRLHHRLVLISFLLLGSLYVSSQNEMGVSFKRLFMDYQTLNGGDFGALKDYTNGFEFGVHFPLSEHFMINIPVKIGLSNKPEELTNQHIFGVDAQAHYFFLRNPDRYKPYLLAGVGGVSQAKDSINVQVPVGIGLDIRIAKNAYINLQSEYRWSSTENNDNFNHAIGFKYFFTRHEPDTLIPPADLDMDGIVDEFDACPTVPGLAAFAGCPDRDGDGVQDSNDNCPDNAGLIEFQGCPDSDGDRVIDMLDKCPNVPGLLTNDGCPLSDKDADGIYDTEDQCPDVAGLPAFKGCPDTDGDGVPDHEDRCPKVAGLVSLGGCPDTDKDGIEDSKDKCPNMYGPVSNGGCPIIEEKDREVLSFAMKAVQFELGKATLKSESYSILNQIYGIMNKYPDYVLSIEGHTDNTGTKEINQRLSESRAKACYEYLVQKGIPPSRMKYKGFGQNRPIADNNTYSGRTLNRRVEFNLIPAD
jgi:outer membrane protein OmpA-like peptidoglycan-associated protein